MKNKYYQSMYVHTRSDMSPKQHKLQGFNSFNLLRFDSSSNFKYGSCSFFKNPILSRILFYD